VSGPDVAAFRCSDAARARGDAMTATAPPALRWLLLEHPGPWPVRALDALDPTLARGLSVRAESLGARVVLVRRPGRYPREPGPMRWAVADARPGREAIRWSRADDVREVLVADWDLSGRPGPSARTADEPVALVCTHGRHDVCCAVRGRPVAAVLETHWPGRVWECSHLGGDRFAASVVLLPHGLCYGRVEPSDVPRLLAAHEQRRVVPELLRGRSSLDRPAQAAQALLRERHPSLDGIDALLPLRSRALGEGSTEVVLAGDPAWNVLVQQHDDALPTPATCRSTSAATAARYVLLDARPLTSGGPRHDL